MVTTIAKILFDLFTKKRNCVKNNFKIGKFSYKKFDWLAHFSPWYPMGRSRRKKILKGEAFPKLCSTLKWVHLTQIGPWKYVMWLRSSGYVTLYDINGVPSSNHGPMPRVGFHVSSLTNALEQLCIISQNINSLFFPFFLWTTWIFWDYHIVTRFFSMDIWDLFLVNWVYMLWGNPLLSLKYCVGKMQLEI